MTSRAPQWFEQKYMSGVIHVIQDEGYRLKGCVNETGEVKGNQVTWKLAGAGQATIMSTAIEERPVMNADRATVSATMVDYEANEWVLTTDIEKMSQNEQQVAQQTGAYAFGRLFDNLNIATLDAAAGAIETIDVSANAAPSVVDTITASGRILSQGFTAAPELYCALPQMNMLQLEMYREFSSADYVGDRPMLKLIGARTYKGVTYIPLPDSQFSVPSAGNVDYYVGQKTALGFVPNYALKSRIDYVPTKKAYFAANTMGCATALLLPGGVRRIRSKLPTTLTRPTP
ncbi:phage capsid protein [Methylobacterium sp. CG09_land_8_20_14_0_10_71_15]|uniref:phage capsid protein n=1 Tax=Methylobacterium sp. CG09_land_8_20_14_0_10_71_15 TaxID=1975532 RepID=UPI00257DD381|nr:phage capsid protein [Methylobacterium sp. CG09_land_8_20_14_0_10_71_15]